MNDVLDWVLYARDEVHNVTTVYVNQYLKAQRVLDPGRLPTAIFLNLDVSESLKTPYFPGVSTSLFLWRSQSLPPSLTLKGGKIGGNFFSG